ncbi:MAG: cyclic pyranopterin monophosphate synthase MoaC [Clostridiales bacterium]|nr:cyclic pyranopterin monophosphate synthase MoaC [Clostridiales bacterium]
MSDFTHFNEKGRARMVDVTDKGVTCRTAVAFGRVLVNRETFHLIKTGGLAKGDVLTTAQIGGIMAAKHTPDLIPMCHPLPLTGVDMNFTLNEEDLAVEITATARCTGVTGVEMEALTAVSVGALTVYDMCKAVQKDMVIDRICLLKKTGGKSGVFERSEEL